MQRRQKVKAEDRISNFCQTLGIPSGVNTTEANTKSDHRVQSLGFKVVWGGVLHKNWHAGFTQITFHMFLISDVIEHACS